MAVKQQRIYYNPKFKVFKNNPHLINMTFYIISISDVLLEQSQYLRRFLFKFSFYKMCY